MGGGPPAEPPGVNHRPLIGMSPISGQPMYESIYGKDIKAIFQKVNNRTKHRIR